MATWLVKVRQAVLRSSSEKWIMHPQKKEELFYSQDPHNCNRASYSIVGSVEPQFLKAERTWVDHMVASRAWVALALVDGKPKTLTWTQDAYSICFLFSLQRFSCRTQIHLHFELSLESSRSSLKPAGT